jgi:hypothetical protein
MNQQLEPNQPPRLYTINPVEPNPKVPFTPEFCRMSDLRILFGLSRAMGYVLVNEGKIRSVSLRRPGHLTGVRLVDVASVREFLNSRAESSPTAKQIEGTA